MGRSLLDIVPPDERAWVLGHIAELCRRREPIVHENTVRRADGRLRHYQWSDHVVVGPDGAIVELQGVGRDITERRLAEDALRTSEARLARMFDLAPIGMAVVELGGGRVKKSDSIDHSVGVIVHYKVGDLVQKNTPLFTIHANDEDRLAAARRRLLAAHTFSDSPIHRQPLFYRRVAS